MTAAPWMCGLRLLVGVRAPTERRRASAAHLPIALRSGSVVAARAAATIAAAVLLGATTAEAMTATPRSRAPVSQATLSDMRERGMTQAAPVLLRVFKKESELEVWKQTRDGQYALLKTLPICRWSGRLGPKRKTGDRQAPEGFYAITAKLMNPNSSYHLSFDTGFPNAVDRANGSTGSHLMVHGACSSMGCYAMTDDGATEVYALMREAFAAGQKSIQFQAFPFRMTARNMARHRDDPDMDFWRQLKIGYDRFEATRMEPTVTAAGRRYGFAAYRNAELEARARARLAAEHDAIADAIDDGAPSVRTTYADGGMHMSFARLRNQAVLGVISRPEALPLAGREIVLAAGQKAPRIVVTALTLYGVRPEAIWFAVAGPAPVRVSIPARRPQSAEDPAAQRIVMAHTAPLQAAFATAAPRLAADLMLHGGWPTPATLAASAGAAPPAPNILTASIRTGRTSTAAQIWRTAAASAVTGGTQ